MRNPSKNTLKTLLRVNNGSPTPGWAMRKADYFLFNEVGARAYIMSKGKICNRQPKGYERYLTPHCKTIYQNSKLVMYLSLEFIEPTFTSSFSSTMRDTKLDQFKALVAELSMTLDESSNIAVKEIYATGFNPIDYYNIEYRNVARVKLITDCGYTVRAIVNNTGSHWQLQVAKDVWLNFFSLAVANTYIPTGLESDKAVEAYFVDKPINIAQGIYANKVLSEQAKIPTKFPSDLARTSFMQVEQPKEYFFISLEHDSRQMRTSMHTILKDLQTLKDELQ